MKQYWHKIIEVSKEYKELHPDIKVGMIITHFKKHDGAVDWFSNGKFYDAGYTLKYLGTCEDTLDVKEKAKLIESWNK